MEFAFSLEVNLLHPFLVRRLVLIAILSLLILPALVLCADTFKLNSGQEVSGELLDASANDAGVQIKVGEGDYKKVAWSEFSQDDLKKFAQKKKLEQLVEPFIEISQEEKLRKTEVNIKPPPRLEKPPRQSLLKALFSSTLGLVVLALVYAANIYAGYEVALFRAQPPMVVAGLSAIPLLGFVAPIIFLSMPTRLKSARETLEPAPEGAVAQAAAAAGAPAPSAGADELNPMQNAAAAHPAGLRLAAEKEAPKSELPATTTFPRGQFTFNRRFFETRFVNFFGVVRRDADKDLVLVIKSARGEYIGQRISRIAANDMHLQVQRGPATEEVMIPFTEIKEVQIKHKDAA